MQPREKPPRLGAIASAVGVLLALASCGGPGPTASIAIAPVVSPSASAAPTVIPSPSKSLSLTPSPTPAPSLVTTTFQLEGRRVEWCGSIGGCGAYATIVSDALPEKEVPIEVGDGFGNVAGLPAQIPIGMAIIRFRTVVVSDARTNTGPVSEGTEATCEARIDARAGVGVLVQLTIRDDACSAEVFSVVTIID